MAALSTWHEHHETALVAVRDIDRLPAHVLLESTSVLTRLPGGLARPLPQVVAALRVSFGGRLFTLPGPQHRAMLEALAEAGLAGGAVYDALIAATARHHGVRLLTLDQRAIPTYRALGTDVTRVAG
ncbi:MAG: PIN domain-containing protein [Actinomycetota bacterium]|nr:PIN domain-containing protein [Actinomycetota bacterium]